MHNEIDFLMNIEGTGVITHEGGSAMANCIREWLATPKGTVWGAPWWGNSLGQYRHNPPDDDTASSMENSILLSITQDIPNIQIYRIGVEPVDMDVWKITIVTKEEVIKEGVYL